MEENKELEKQEDIEKSAQTEECAQTEEKAQEEGKKKKNRRVIWVSACGVIVAVLAVLVVAYLKKAAYYETCFFPNTRINNMDCSELDVQTVAQMLDAQAQSYSLTISGRDENGESVELGVIGGAEIGLKLVDSLSAANDVLAQQDGMRWYETWGKGAAHYGYSIVQDITFDEDLLRQKLESFAAFREENMKEPQNAYIGDYVSAKNEFEMVPEVDGTLLDMEALVVSVKTAIYEKWETLNLEEQGLYALPQITAENQELLANLNMVNQWLKTDITYDWNTYEVKVDKSVLKDWISVVDNQPVLDEAAVADFVNQNAKKYDTYGKTRKFVTTLGVELSLPSGAFGWKTDKEAQTAELIALIKEGTVEKREPIYSRKAPQKGMNDIGNSYVEADITHQHLYLYSKGNLVLETDFVSGDMSQSGCVTPAGVFGVTYKTTNVVLRGADYESPVSYWMPYHGNFGMHDATWREEFGGDFYVTGQGSHGCLNLPLDKAAAIYNYVSAGFPVICYYY